MSCFPQFPDSPGGVIREIVPLVGFPGKIPNSAVCRGTGSSPGWSSWVDAPKALGVVSASFDFLKFCKKGNHAGI